MKNKFSKSEQPCTIHSVNGWRFIENNKQNLEDMPVERDFEILFDDGTICKFSDTAFPYAKLIAWREFACR